MVVEQRSKAGMASEPPTLLGSTAVRPPDRRGLEALRYCLHNPETGTYIGRTPKHWAQLLLFFSIFYTCLGAFWYGMLQVFFVTVPIDHPKYVLEQSIIGVNPGLGVQPAQSDDFVESAMFVFQHDARKDAHYNSLNVGWADRLSDFLSRYEDVSGTRDCSSLSGYNREEEACRFDVASLGDCGNFPYGYMVDNGTVTPCVVLKLNRIFGWEPQAYDSDSDFHKEERSEFRRRQRMQEEEEEEETMKAAFSLPPSHIQSLSTMSPENVFLDCQGLWPADREALDGNIRYFPSNQALPFSFFPFRHAKSNYHQPLVAVQFHDVPIGQLIHVECRAWARGLRHLSKERIGSVQFELLLQ